jgi:hypothetical protein
MRKRLMAAAAFAPLTLFGLHPAYAQTTVGSSTALQYVTSATGDLTIASGNTVQPTVSGAIVTLNSNNTVTNVGTLTTKDVTNVVGVLVPVGSFSGSILNQGEINLTEGYTPTDSVNNDGITEAPYAQGTNRYGIQSLGVLTGNIINSGSIDIQGNNSVGIQIAAGLNGQLQSTGAITVTGDQTFGIRTAGEITGGVQISNAITVKGLNAVGVQTTGQIDGSLAIYSSISATGYAVTSRVTGTQALTNIENTPADVQQGGIAVQVQGNVTGGIFIGAPPSGTVSTDTTTDADGDGIVDSVEGTGSIISYGSSPALQIGSPTQAITIGNFNSISPYGLTVEGSISANGVFDGYSATAVDIGAGGKGVALNGGINIIGTVSATAYQADATAIHLENGTTGFALRNSGTLSSSVTSAGANTASALIIDQGASLTQLINYGAMSAAATGDVANAQVVVDKSGSINLVENTGSITAALAPTNAGETVTGKAIALDLRNNTTGVSLRQEINGTVAPTIVGDIFLSQTGPNTVNLLSGSINGVLSLGSGVSSLTIDGGGIYTGALSYTGNALAVNVVSGKFQNNATGAFGLSSLNVGGSSSLVVALDPQKNAATTYNVSGAATFANGATIGATLLSTPTTTQTFTIVKAGSLTIGSSDTALLTTLPYLFNGSLTSNKAAGTISLTVSTKTAAQLGFNKAETAALPAVLAALPQDSGIQTAIISSVDRPTLTAAYDRLLPNSGGDVFLTALNMSKAVSRATADRFDLSTQDDDDEAPATTGMWASEFYVGVDQQKGDNNAFHSAGLGVIGGVDFGGFGATLAMGSANATHPHETGDSLNSISMVEGGFYMAPRFGPLSLDARVGGGYLKMTDRRQFIATIVSGDTSTSSSVSRSAEGDWNGYDLTGHVGAGIQVDATKHLFFQPKVYADFFHVQEDAYNERGGGSGFDLDVLARTSTQTSATASLVSGMKFGSSFIFSPQIELGYDQVLQGGPGNTTARFAYAGAPNFTVQPNTVGGAGVARFVLKGDGNYVHFSFQGGGEFRSDYKALDLRAVFRMTY